VKTLLPMTGMLIALSVAFPVLAREQTSESSRVEALRREISELREQLKRQKEYEARLNELEQRLRELEFSRDLPARETPGEKIEETPEAELERLVAEQQFDVVLEPEPFALSLGRAFQSFNPDISVIGDFLLHYDSREDGDLDDEFLFREVEIGLSGYVDPYARADIFLGIHKEHAHHEVEEEHEDHAGGYELHVEEAYLTFLTLPWDLKAKVGKFKANFGKVNNQHLHALPWVEYPLVIRNYFGHEGLAGEGASISWLVPNPWDNYVELTYELFNNDNPHLFAGDAADDFVHLVHFKNFFDLSESSTLEIGFSAATAPNDDAHGGSRTWIEGADLTFKWRPPSRGLYKSVMCHTELMAVQKDLDDGEEDSLGLFTAIEHQFARQWAAGARYDFSQLPDESRLRENAYSAYLTFLQSEYCFWRLGYQYSDRNFAVTGDEQDHQLFLQLNFGLGPHRAHKY